MELNNKTLWVRLLLLATATAGALISPAHGAEGELHGLISPRLSNSAPRPEINLTIPATDKLVSIDLASQPRSAWQALRRGFSIPDVSNTAVRQYERAFLKHRNSFKAMLTQAEPYLFYVIEEVEKRGLPTELALLPFIESKYNPEAHSKASAAGLWQFIPSTGKHFNLVQNRYVDERRDVKRSTEAALDYLTYLYDLKGDWHLALVAYNWGEGSVSKAMRAAMSNDQEPTWANLQLPAETQKYLPKLQALKNLIAYPEKYGLKLPKIAYKPYFVEIKYNRNLDLRELSRHSRVPLNELRPLNSGLKQPLLLTSNPRPFLVPVHHAPKIMRAIENYKEPKTGRSYRVQAGDTLGHIADRFDVTVRDLQAANGMGSRSMIRPGMSLTIPQSTANQKDWTS